MGGFELLLVACSVLLHVGLLLVGVLLVGLCDLCCLCLFGLYALLLWFVVVGLFCLWVGFKLVCSDVVVCVCF